MLVVVRPSGRPVFNIGWPPFLACSPLMQVTHAGACVGLAAGRASRNRNRVHRRLRLEGGASQDESRGSREVEPRAVKVGEGSTRSAQDGMQGCRGDGAVDAGRPGRALSRSQVGGPRTDSAAWTRADSCDGAEKKNQQQSGWASEGAATGQGRAEVVRESCELQER